MYRRFIATLLLGTAICHLTFSARGEAEPAPKATEASTKTDADSAAKLIIEKEQAQLRQYKTIAETLLSLAQRLEKSSRLEDQDKAKLIRRALELGDKEGVENKFQTILRTLTGRGGQPGLIDISQGKNQNDELVKVLNQILEILMSDDEMARIRAEKDFLEKRLAELKSLIRETKVQRALTESGKGDQKKLAKEQDKIKDNTDNLAKRLEGSDGKKGDAKEKQSPGMGKDGKGGEGKDGKGGDGKGGMGGMGGQGSQSPPSQSTQRPKSPGADQVRKAVPDQAEAAKKIEENKRPDAVTKQTDAIKSLEDAQKELEKRLKQLREDELERLLANLEARVAKMLQWQIEVYEATKSIDAIIQKSETKKAEKPEIQKAQVQADKETQIIAEANKTIEILKSEGSAVAFPRVFEETVVDMTRVRERLDQADAGINTQEMEKDIIATLKEMLEALKKAQQELQNSKGQPSSGGGPPPDQKLLDEIAELKMIRNLQVRVNERTKRRGDELQGAEQATPQMKVEIKDLANRQVKIEEMARDIATGKNK